MFTLTSNCHIALKSTTNLSINKQIISVAGLNTWHKNKGNNQLSVDEHTLLISLNN